ncbi:hypothetical protein D3C73_1011070 [compost metagenome]
MKKNVKRSHGGAFERQDSITHLLIELNAYWLQPFSVIRLEIRARRQQLEEGVTVCQFSLHLITCLHSLEIRRISTDEEAGRTESMTASLRDICVGELK